MNLFPFILLMICLPLGSSPQSLCIAVVTGILLTRDRKKLKDILPQLTRSERGSLGLLLAVIILPIISTLLNSKNPETDVVSYFLGFIPLLIVPILFLATKAIPREGLVKLEKFWTILMLCWLVVAITQNIWGWKIQGTSFVSGDHFMRSQGFYSHPLTLAYVSLMLWPLHLVAFCKEAGKWNRLVLLISNLGLLYLSASRTAQAVALLIAVGFTLTYFKGRTRAILFASMVAVLVAIFSTTNPITRRFTSMSTQMLSEEKESAYADDRIAFWIVHWNMVKERPILGHGINLNRKYRLPYYDAIGLPDFKKAYEAHNQLLQLAAEGGIFTALAFLAWLASLHRNWRNSSRTIRQIRDLTLICLFLGGLTQNAYFDGEVRFALMTLTALVYAIGIRSTASEP